MYAGGDFNKDPDNIAIRDNGSNQGWAYQMHYHMAGRIWGMLKKWEADGEGMDADFNDLKTAHDLWQGAAVLIVSGGNAGYMGYPSDRECPGSSVTDIDRCAGGTPLWEFFMARVQMRFLRDIHMSPILKASVESTYPGWFDNAVSFIGTNIFEKWEQNTVQNGGGFRAQFYRNKTHMSMEAGEFALYYWEVTGDTNALEIAQDIYYDGIYKWTASVTPPSNNFFGQLTETGSPTRYVWNSDWNGGGTALQDVNHWGHFTSSIIAGYEANINANYNVANMAKFANTLDHVMTSYPSYSTTANVDGVGSGSDPGNLTFLFLFGLGQFNETVQDLIGNNIDANDGNVEPYAGVAYYNQWMIENGRPTYPEWYVPIDGTFDGGGSNPPPPTPSESKSILIDFYDN